MASLAVRGSIQPWTTRAAALQPGECRPESVRFKGCFASAFFAVRPSETGQERLRLIASRQKSSIRSVGAIAAAFAPTDVHDAKSTTSLRISETFVELRKRNQGLSDVKAPIVIFIYYNPLLKRGVGKFLEEAKAAGASSINVLHTRQDGLHFLSCH